ncbi:MAG: toll/interleukin-1 receptor domain-containing protein [Nitrospiraceae bacterium]
MADIFISYASVDRARAQILAEALPRQGRSVWWDRNIPPGKTFSQVIKEELDAAKCVIVVWSKASVASEWVEIEAAEAKQRGILVPALIDDVAKAIPLEFRRLQAARLVDWQGESTHPEFHKLVEAVATVLGQPVKAETEQVTFGETKGGGAPVVEHEKERIPARGPAPPEVRQAVDPPPRQLALAPSRDLSSGLRSRLSLTLILTIGAVYWLYPLDTPAVIIVVLISYTIAIGLTFVISRVFRWRNRA